VVPLPSPARKASSRRLIVFLAASVVMTRAGLSQQGSHSDVWLRMLQDAYSAHLSRVLAALPPHSGVPPLLDLTSKPEENSADRAWEDRFKGWGFSRGITDPGVPGPSEATSIATTFVESVGRPSALPARSCEAVLIAIPVAANSQIDHTHTLVYSRYSLKISKVLKGKQKHGFVEGGQIRAVQMGGRVLFPSGHMTSFILPREGFLDTGKQYLLFIWTPPGTETDMISNSYLIQDGRVFPLELEPDVSAYDNGMSFKEFEARVKFDIAKNIDTN